MRLSLAAGSLFLAFCPCAAIAVPSHRESLDLAERLSDEGQFTESESVLRKILAEKPDDPDAEVDLAGVDMAVGRYEEAISLLENAIKQMPEALPLYRDLAHAYAVVGHPEKTKEVLARVRKIPGRSAVEYMHQGYFELRAGDTAEAKGDFESVISVDPASFLGYHHMGAFLAKTGRYSEAEKYFRRALERLEADPNADPDDVSHTYAWLGLTLKGEKRLPEAEGWLLKALKKARPGGERQMNALKFLGQLYVAWNKPAQAEEFFKRAVDGSAGDRCPAPLQSRASVDLASFYFRQGRRAEAKATLSHLEDQCAVEPMEEKRIFYLKRASELYAQLGDDSKNEALLSRLLPLRQKFPFEPELAWVETGLAELSAKRKEWADAKHHYRDAAGILERHREWGDEADAFDAVAEIEEKEGKPQDAAADREKAKALRARP